MYLQFFQLQLFLVKSVGWSREGCDVIIKDDADWFWRAYGHTRQTHSEEFVISRRRCFRQTFSTASQIQEFTTEIVIVNKIRVKA